MSLSFEPISSRKKNARARSDFVRPQFDSDGGTIPRGKKGVVMHFVVLLCECGMQLSCAVRFQVFVVCSSLCFLVDVECSCLVMCAVVFLLV